MKTHHFFTLLACLAIALFNSSGVLAQSTLQQVAANDCGTTGKQPFLIKGDSYTFESQPPASFSAAALSCNFGASVIYAFDKMDIQADYEMEISFLADGERVIQLEADGNAICPPITVPAWKEVRQRIQLPKKAYAYGQLVLVLEALKGPNAVVSEIALFSSNPSPLVALEGEKREALKQVQAYTINTNVDVEAVLPTLAPRPSAVTGVYHPVMSLNGVWQFSESEKGDTWHPIQVPGQWSMQGFKVDSAGWARYRTSFSLPKDWKKQVVHLRFDGVHSEYKVFLNGKELGYHAGGMTPYELNITNALREGGNELQVTVRSESEADMLGSLTQYAAHQLGGITRKVTLFALPALHIEDVRVVTDLDDRYTDARLKVFVAVKNEQATEARNSSLRLTLDGHSASLTAPLPALKAGERWAGWLQVDVAAPRLWDNEHPNLYTLTTALVQEGGELQSTKQRIGFREVKVEGNRLLVNGVPVKLRGVCRHEAHPLTGRVVSAELARRDAELYREANCNFVRTSHYPCTEEFVAICDELGLFVEMEAPVCWIGHHANENWKQLNYRDPAYYPYVLQANMETIHFYRNHPSILFWSMANESYWNKEFAQVGEYLKKADPTRPYTFHDQAYGGFNNQGSNAPIANIHYPGPNGYKTAATSTRPMVYGEYCHLNVYNRSELVTDPGVRSDWALALAPTWENMYKTDGVLGGSIWSGIDDIFQLPNGDAVGYGPWGPIDGWRRPKPEYWDMKKIYSPIRLLTEALAPATHLRLEVENRYSYTNLNELKIVWRYGKQQGVVLANAAPGTRTTLDVEVANPAEANELSLTFIDPRGFVADEYLLPVGKQEQNSLPDWEAIPTRLKSTKEKFTITGVNFVCEINRSSGQIQSLRRNGREQITGGPWLMVLPLNGGGCYPNHNANTPLFNDLCSEWSVTETRAQSTPTGVEVTIGGEYKECAGSFTLLINANGELTASYRFESKEEVNPRQWGIVFEAPGQYNTLFWRRKGIWSVYPDDHISRPTGEAPLFNPAVPQTANARICPTWAWSQDANELGSNDFRSTRRNIWYAGLKADNGSRVTVRSNGEQHWRSWRSGEKVRFLVADFVSAGNEMFLSSYYAPYRKPLKAGDTVTGTITLRVE